MSGYVVAAGKRLAIEESSWIPGWYVGASPRNGNEFDEGQWCQWVHLARLILAHDLTQRYVPSEHRLYPDPPYLYDGCHPDCIGCLGGNDETSS